MKKILELYHFLKNLQKIKHFKANHQRRINQNTNCKNYYVS